MFEVLKLAAAVSADTVLKILSPALYELLGVYGLAPRKPTRPHDYIETRLTEALRALQDSSSYLSELQSNIAEQKRLVEQVRTEHEHYQTLAGLEREKAAALLKVVDATVKSGTVSERWKSFALALFGNFIFFLLGVFSADKWLGEWIRPWWP